MPNSFADVDDLVNDVRVRVHPDAVDFSKWVNGQGQPIHETYSGLRQIQRDRQEWRRQRGEERRTIQKMQKAATAAKSPSARSPRTMTARSSRSEREAEVGVLPIGSSSSAPLDFESYVEQTVSHNRRFSITSSLAGSLFKPAAVGRRIALVDDDDDSFSTSDNSHEACGGDSGPRSAHQSRTSPSSEIRRGRTAIEGLVLEFDRRYHERLEALKASQASRDWVAAGQRLATEQQRSIRKHVTRVARATRKRHFKRVDQVMSTRPEPNHVQTRRDRPAKQHEEPLLEALSPLEAAAVEKHLERQRAGREGAGQNQRHSRRSAPQPSVSSQRKPAHTQQSHGRSPEWVIAGANRSAFDNQSSIPPATVSMINFSSSQHFDPNAGVDYFSDDSSGIDAQASLWPGGYDVEFASYGPEAFIDPALMSDDSMDDSRPRQIPQHFASPPSCANTPGLNHTSLSQGASFLSPEHAALGKEVATLRRAVEYARRTAAAEAAAAEADLVRHCAYAVIFKFPIRHVMVLCGHAFKAWCYIVKTGVLIECVFLCVLSPVNAFFCQRERRARQARQLKDDQREQFELLQAQQHELEQIRQQQEQLAAEQTSQLEAEASLVGADVGRPQDDLRDEQTFEHRSDSNMGTAVPDGFPAKDGSVESSTAVALARNRPNVVVVHNEALAATLCVDDDDSEAPLPTSDVDSVQSGTEDGHEARATVSTPPAATSDVPTTPVLEKDHGTVSHPMSEQLTTVQHKDVDAIMTHYQQAYESSLSFAQDLQKENQRLWELLKQAQDRSTSQPSSPLQAVSNGQTLRPNSPAAEAVVEHYKTVGSSTRSVFFVKPVGMDP